MKTEETPRIYLPTGTTAYAEFDRLPTKKWECNIHVKSLLGDRDVYRFSIPNLHPTHTKVWKEFMLLISTAERLQWVEIESENGHSWLVANDPKRVPDVSETYVLYSTTHYPRNLLQYMAWRVREELVGFHKMYKSNQLRRYSRADDFDPFPRTNSGDLPAGVADIKLYPGGKKSL